MRRGQRALIRDPEGQQVVDMWAFTTGDPLDWLSTSQTRDVNERLFPAIGEAFYSEQAIPLLTFVDNGSPFAHDMLFPACNAGLYKRAGLPGHPNCRDNLVRVVKEEGLVLPVVPDPVNFFQNSKPQADGRLEVLASDNPPGGFVVLQAEQDLLLVLTSCAVDFHPTNGGCCTPIEIEIS